MTRIHGPRTILVTVLVATVGALPVWAEPHVTDEGRPARLAAAGAFSQLWSLLTELWSEEGCIIDPYGGCGAGSAPLGDAGCGLDPHGGCGDAPRGSLVKAGCGLDPYGCPGTRSTPNADAGCGIDPHGGACSR
jgi:hypothetical protein